MHAAPPPAPGRQEGKVLAAAGLPQWAAAAHVLDLVRRAERRPHATATVPGGQQSVPVWNPVTPLATVFQKILFGGQHLPRILTRFRGGSQAQRPSTHGSFARQHSLRRAAPRDLSARRLRVLRRAETGSGSPLLGS
jgi:hypothetical protein